MRWSEALAGIARTGLGFTSSLYERERFEEVLAVAADIRASAGGDSRPEDQIHEWMRQVGEGVAGYVTPKAAIGAGCALANFSAATVIRSKRSSFTMRTLPAASRSVRNGS